MADIAECISFLTSAAAKSMGRLARDRLAPLGVTPVQYALMRSLSERPGATGAEISARLFIDSATMTGLVDRLEKLALVARRSDGGDRRVNRLHLTQRGTEMMPQLDRAIEAVNTEADRRLGPEAARFRAALKTLIETA
jgi:MarR family transcriptional regulator, organic hydroperoxide resistance regulator